MSRHVLPLLSLAFLLAVSGCGQRSASAQKAFHESLDPNPPVDASAASAFITVTDTQASEPPPLTILQITCAVLKEGTLVAEWPSAGGQIESVELVPQPDATGNAVLVINPVRCLKGQKVTIRPKEG
ncbi:MAG: hypothetical protein V2A58_10010 [Planctomycetota bacterium]